MEKIKQGYKQTDIGVIPEDWEVKDISSFTSITSGGTPSTTNKLYWGGSIRWMNSGELNLKFVQEVVGRITEEGLRNSSTKFIPKNCVLIGLAGQGKTRGTAAINLIETCINQSIGAILPSEQFEPNYLYYYIDNKYLDLRLLSSGDGGRGGLTKSLLSKYKVALPPLVEQTAIATALSDTDTLIAALDKKIAKKQQIKQGAMQQLLTGKKRLPGFSGEWVEKKLGEVGKINMGQSPSSQFYNSENKGLPLIQGNADIEKRITIIRMFTSQITKKCEVGDIILSVRAPVGAVAKATFNACIGRGVCAIRSNNDFLYQYLVYVENDWAKYSKGSTFDSINSNELYDVSMSVPTSEIEQTAIAQILTDMDHEIAQLEKERDKYKELKAGMMQVLLTGRVRLV